SAPIRTRVRDAPDRDALYWTAGMAALDFLAPVVQALGLRLVCNEARAWSLRNAEYRASGSITFRDGVNIIAASEELSRDSDDWFQGAVFPNSWDDG
ncbi:hypothetical protein, partial [Microbacterium sp. GbtcB4]|uniref:hypothetical protein n=1 Tax=Microbacterium sp. GbtcB4 TaxID=2824749 RepID=UPI001C2F2B32